MILQPVLEFNKSNENDSIFYRYNVGGAKVWFDQHIKTGHIYTVYVSLPDSLKEFQVYVECDADKLFFPIKVHMQSNCLRGESDDLLKYAEQLIQLKAIMDAINAMFASGSHHCDIWSEHRMRQEIIK